MKQTIAAIFMTCAASVAFSQTADEPPKFLAADIRLSPKTQFPFVRTTPVHGGRYEIKFATMVDLVHLAYGIDADKVMDGPNWLEMDRFDITAKAPPDSTPESHKLMLQSLLADRFKLVIHNEKRPLPTYALVAGKKPQLKEADGKEDTGCKPAASTAGRGEGTITLMTMDQNGAQTTLHLGPGMTVEYACRNITMAAFADGLRTMMGASLGQNPILDETGLKGAWNFNVKWSIQLMGPMGGGADERISVFDAMEKQLGLKLEQRQVPTPVIAVDKVNEKPSDNPPGTAEALPTIPTPTEFEVASVKPADPVGRGMRSQTQPGGRVTITGMPMRLLVTQAFNINSIDRLAGLPAWADSERFDIIAKAPSEGPEAPPIDREATAPMMRALLVDRFKMTYHTEDRQIPAFFLVAAKPKMKKADPASRTYCKNGNAPPGAPPATRILNCQNVTMAQFVDRLQNISPDLNGPVADATGLEGTWDFTLTFSFNFQMPMRAGGDGAGATGGPAAADPTGTLSVLEALEKQLGLKIEKQKRSMPVIVIDHLEQRPTEN